MLDYDNLADQLSTPTKPELEDYFIHRSKYPQNPVHVVFGRVYQVIYAEDKSKVFKRILFAPF